MKYLLCVFFLGLFITALAKEPLPGSARPVRAIPGNQPLCFIENAGQVTDQDGRQRGDIDYKIAVPGMNVFIGKGGMHYMLHGRQRAAGSPLPAGSLQAARPDTGTAETDLYRLDVRLLGANKHAHLIAEEAQEYKEMYYGPHHEGLTAHSCRKIIYKDIYPGIDWVLYARDNQLEYDFVVRPGGRVADIRLSYGGASSLAVSQGGLSAVTPLGAITEHQPRAYRQEDNKAVASQFALQGNIVSFSAGSCSGTLVIDPDPALDWATYYGGNVNDGFGSVKCDAGGNLYAGGFASSSNNIATAGSYQSTFMGSNYDAFLVKFNASGARQWGTYYGSGALTEGLGIDCDAAGNVYMTGEFTLIPPISRTSSDAFLVKFDATGALRWAVSLAGSGLDVGQAVACDGAGSVYMTGYTGSNGNITTPGSYQHAHAGGYDAFLAKYDTAGSLQWATYFGGANDEQGLGVACSGTGSVYMTGCTGSAGSIATPGSYQPALAGGSDAFLASFNSSGQLQWATYYGNAVNNATVINGYDIGDKVSGNVACDQLGHVYICGSMQSPGYATAGSFQPAPGAGYNAYLAQFSAAGALQWATYYGGNNSFGTNTACDTLGNVYLTGIVDPISVNVATPAAYQSAYGGAFLAKFNRVGRRQWGTYYGGAPVAGHSVDRSWAVACYAPDVVYIAGYTPNTANIATPGGFQVTMEGKTGGDGFLARFHSGIASVSLAQPFTDTFLCAGGSFLLNYTVGETFQPGNVFTAQLSDASGSFARPVAIGSLTAIDTGVIPCTLPATLAGAGYKVRIVASYPANTSDTARTAIVNLSGITASASPACLGNTITLQADSIAAGQAYRWTGPNAFSSNTRIALVPGADNSDSGVYTVVTTAGSCTRTVMVHVVVSPAPAKPAAGSNSPLCAGGVINLTATAATPGASIAWTGPNGFHSTLQNPVITGAPVTDSGLYIVTASLGGCSVSDSIVVVVTNPSVPAVSITTSTPYLVPGYPGTFHAHVTGCAAPAYQWYRGSTPLAGKTDSVLTITIVQHDSIRVVMHCSSGCIRPDSAVSNYLGVGIASVNKGMNSVVIYPNPVKEVLVIEHAAGATARLCSVVGQVLRQQVLKGDRETIDTAELPAGTFVVELRNEDGAWYSKVIVKE